MKRLLPIIVFVLVGLFTHQAVQAWEGMAMPRLHVDGRYFKDDQGNIVNLHGFAQTYSPWFNEQGTQWTNYNVSGCLSYNKQKIDQILAAGWKMSFVRMHMDPYWSNTPGVSTTGENDISAFSFTRFKKYLDEVFVPMAVYAVSKGLYVVMRPPGVCPETIAVGDAYHQYLLKVWEYVAQHPALRNHPNIMFELANEPVKILNANGGSGSFKELNQFFQEIVDVMRAHCDNILLIPGLSWQANYEGFADYPIEGDNIAYAVHCYPGWFNSGAEDTPDVNYADFKAGWDKQIKPVSDFAPIIVTEMDWAPEKYNASWGKGVTGTAGGTGFGANFKKIADESGNVSYLIFTGCEYLAKFDANNPATSANTTFLNDPEACPWPTYHWYQEYADMEYTQPDYGKVVSLKADQSAYSVLIGSGKSMVLTATFADGSTRDVTILADYEVAAPNVLRVRAGRITPYWEGTTNVTASYTDSEGTTVSVTVPVSAGYFPLTAAGFNPSIWETGTFDEATGTLRTGQYGFGGWEYPNGIDLSHWKYIVVELHTAQSNGGSFRIFDEVSYWSTPAQVELGSQTRIVVEMAAQKKGTTTTLLDPSNIYRIGFWSYGSGDIRIKRVYLSQDGVTGIELPLPAEPADALVNVYSIDGVLLYKDVTKADAMRMLQRGIYIIGREKVAVY